MVDKMTLTLKDYIDCGKLLLDDFPIYNIPDELGVLITNSLPLHIKCDILNYGFSDTPTREAIFMELIKRLGFSSSEEYYSSSLADNYFKNKVELSEEQRILVLSKGDIE